jgi:eukaryotic-like serine/threonine-protein kinase
MIASNVPVAVGDVLAGKYRVERVLGAGGMGIVVAAEHMQLRRLVAIKFVLPDSLGSHEAVERFLREARAVVRLRSEHVARVIDVGTLANGAPYMVMEFLEGWTLGAILEHESLLPFDRIAWYIIQACEALAEAHSLGIVHRDLKPENIFLTRSVSGAPLIKVLDFGVSKMESLMGTRGLTRTAALMGSPLYMAPEQMRSARDATPRSDIWALGIVLYQLVTKHLPFDADSIPELCLKVALEPPIPLLSRRPDVPPALEATIRRCLERDHARRFANAAELATALEPFAPPEARATVEQARLIVRGSRPSDTPRPFLNELPVQPFHIVPMSVSHVSSPGQGSTPPSTTTPPPSTTRDPTKHGNTAIAVGTALLGLTLGAAAIVAYVMTKDGGPEPVGAPATLQSGTVGFSTTGAKAKASPLPTTAPAPHSADAGRPAAPPPPRPPRTPPSAPGHDDDIPTMR